MKVFILLIMFLLLLDCIESLDVGPRRRTRVRGSRRTRGTRTTRRRRNRKFNLGRRRVKRKFFESSSRSDESDSDVNVTLTYITATPYVAMKQSVLNMSAQVQQLANNVFTDLKMEKFKNVTELLENYKSDMISEKCRLRSIMYILNYAKCSKLTLSYRMLFDLKRIYTEIMNLITGKRKGTRLSVELFLAKMAYAAKSIQKHFICFS
uniref:Uncharacterized protein n=1 Tax=Clastoptera arizonana TaxID=38151 RepID=A0A1B6D8N6_9HEMI